MPVRERTGARPQRLAALPPILQLKDDVEESIVDGALVLHSRSDLRGVKISRGARPMLPSLKDGVTFEELCGLFGSRAPATQRAKLAAFVGILERAGLLRETDAGRAALVRYAVWDLSGPARRLGAWLRASRPATALALTAGVIVLLALVYGASLILPQLIDLGRAVAAQPPAIAFGVVVVLTLVVPLHEIAHAVVAGACGVPTTRLVVGRRGARPTVFCEAPGSSLIAERCVRLAIPAAGPAVDLAAGLIFGLLARWQPASLAAPYLAAAGCASLLAFVLDLNPYAPSDGSRILEIVLDDDTARLSALSRRSGLHTMTVAARFYLAASIAYVVSVVCALGAFGVAVYRGLPQ